MKLTRSLQQPGLVASIGVLVLALGLMVASVLGGSPADARTGARQPGSASGSATPPSADRAAAGNWAPVRVVTANIQSVPEMAQPKVQADLNRLKRLGGNILLQEITPDRYKAAVTKTFTGQKWGGTAFVGTSEVPIAYNAAWTVEKRGRELMHRGKAKVTPNRYVTYLQLARTYQGRKIRFVLMDTHFISAAYNNRQDSYEAYRVRKWNQHYDKMQKLIKDFNARGLTVIGGGDFNRMKSRGLKLFTPTSRYLNDQGSIDKIFVSPAKDGARVALTKQSTVGGNSDHAFRIADLKVGPPKAS